MSAGFLAKPLIVEVYRSFVDYGMEQACSIRLLELYDWHISRVEGNLENIAIEREEDACIGIFLI